MLPGFDFSPTFLEHRDQSWRHARDVPAFTIVEGEQFSRFGQTGNLTLPANWVSIFFAHFRQKISGPLMMVLDRSE